MRPKIIKKLIKRLKFYIKNETVLSAAIFLAVISSFFVRPDTKYIGYIDFRTLSLLFCLMAVMGGFQKTGIFDIISLGLLKKVQDVKSLVFILVMLCFFSSMLITNDVALITFVPFAFIVLNKLEEDERNALKIPVIVMQTIAANLGSMLTPVGNPQNLYLQGVSGLGLGEFIMLMLPYASLAFVMLSLWIFLLKQKGSVRLKLGGTPEINGGKKAILYIAAFVVCLMTVARLIDWKITLIVVAVIIAASDINIFKRIDYTLLATFTAFFIFIGNMGRIPGFGSIVGKVINGRECITGVLSSQIISNVPAALLLSGFTDNFKPLITGVNIGGLGTLIASMASLISFKLFGRHNKSLRGKYMIYFTVANIIFLAVLLIEYYILKIFA